MAMATISQSRSDESQASQLLAAALRPREAPDAALIPPSDVEPHSTPLEGSLQSTTNSVHYHIHGLVATQSQSLCGGDEIDLESSQKENTPASWDKSKASSPRNPSPASSPVRTPAGPSYTSEPTETPANASPLRKDSNGKRMPKDCDVHTNDLQSPTKALKAIPFTSPSRPQARIARSPTVPVRQMLPPPKPRSPSPNSQDSFAGPLPQPDPAKAFIAQAKNFTIPLSQLGEDTQSVSDEEGPPPVASDMWPSRRRSPVLHPPSPTGKILVAGTPSNSSHGSQSQQADRQQCFQPTESQSQQGYSESFPQAQPRTIDISDYMGQATQEGNDQTQDEYDADTRVSSPRASTEPTLSYQRLLEFPSAGDQTPPTQLCDQSTQPADETPPTQLVSFDTIAQEHDYYNENGQVEFPTIPSEARSSNTRPRRPNGTRQLVAADKWYRYENIKPEPRTIPWDLNMPQPRPSDVPSNSAPLEQTQLSGESLVPEMIEQTQPSDVAVDGSDMSIFPTRRLPPANHALLSRPIVPPRSPDVVVPDSEGAEPTQVAEPSLPPTRRGLPSASPNASLASPTRTRHQGHLQSEDEVLRTIAAEQPSIPAVQEEEEEEEEEEDEDEEEETTVGPLEEEEEEEEVPLATMVSTEIKGKQRTTARVTASFPVSAKGRAVKAPQSPPKHTIQRDTRSMSWRNVIIPSSDPQERREDAKAAAAKATKSSKRRTPTLAKPIRAPRAAKLAARGKLRESSTEDEADDDVDEDVPDYQSDDHDAVPAEGEMDVDAPDVKPARSNKRKRTVSSTSRKVPSRSIVKEESATPLGRPAKRAKTASVLRGGLHTPTRVFALWIHDAHYYPGIVQEAVPPSKYKIKFDDETTATLDIKHVRLCQLQPGDHVLAPRNRRARVVSVPECASTGHLPEDIITVEYDDVEVEIKLSDVQLASRTITAEWSDRILTKDAITPLVRPKVSRASPTPSVVPSEGSVRGAAKQQLVKTGLVVTLSPNNPEWSHQKDTLMADIKRHGGIVLDDWTTLYTMDGTVEQKGLRWILRQDDIQWKNHKNIERVYLISDDNHQKPKYLIALALGIPCLSVNWLKALVTERGPQDWSSYMLPAGFAEPLNARVSQMVDLDWGNSHNQVKDIRENLVAAKVFAEQSILCVSSSFVPCRQKGKKNGATKKDAAEMVPRIILCMGAATVEAVADFKHASRGLDDYDYVVVPDSDFDRFPDLDVCVDVNWVKNCLISGRLLALPRQQNSQVA